MQIAGMNFQIRSSTAA
ncbi:hypothetical protein [Eisenbergiella tayi]